MKLYKEKRPADIWVALPFLLPALLFTISFFVIPSLKLLYMSFFDWPLNGDPFFIGLYNYQEMLTDANFWQTFFFTLEYTFWITPLLFILSFIYALLVNKGIKGTNLFRSIYFAPVVISMVASCLLWMWIFNDLNGMANYFLKDLGLIDKPVSWMLDKKTSLPIVNLSIIWKMTGFTMMILVASLQAIPDEYYEVATIFGSKWYHTLIHVTIPSLRNAIIMSLMLSITGSILAFDQFKIMTYGGPMNETRTAIMYIYDVGFQYGRLGSAAAISVFLSLFLVVVAIIQLLFIKKSKG